MHQDTTHKTFDGTAEHARRILTAQRRAYLKSPFPGARERREHLAKLERILLENADDIAEAVSRDFGHRALEETKLLEIFTAVDTIRGTRRNLRRWMKPRHRHVSILYATGKNRVIPQPKGVAGIIVPWNYPVLLLFEPLTSALAAGNRCMIKMARNSPDLCRLLCVKFAEQFAQDHVTILPGVKGPDFSSLPFDHLLFTGSPASGRAVMRSASENLTPVTLELGGKSPTVVCDDFDIDTAVSRITYAKLINAGQTCLAPDYVLVPEAGRDAFVEAAKRIVPQRYPDIGERSYTSVVDNQAYSRLRSAIHDARARGATVVSLTPGATFDDSMRKIPPCLLLDVTDAMQVMKEEVFGPILPVLTYRSLDQAIEFINSRERPLGLYIFTNRNRLARHVLYRTMSGGVTINNCLLHVAQHDLPFGGIGNSGMGHYHGYEGFVEFSKLRPVFTQPKVSTLESLYPPYGKRHRRLIDFLLRFKR